MADIRRASHALGHLHDSLSGSSSPDDLRKRVAKACDRCRLKKIKCDGKVPCSRCQSDSTICRYGERKKSVERRIPPGYVDYLEEQQKVLVQALRKVWNERPSKLQTTSSPTEPSINAILANLGVLDEFTKDQPGREHFAFEEDLDTIRRRCEDEDDAAATTTTSSSSSHSSPSHSSTAGATESYRNPFDSQERLYIPSSSQTRFPTIAQRRSNQSAAWRAQYPQAASSFPELHSQDYDSPSIATNDSAFEQQSQQDMDWDASDMTLPAGFEFTSASPDRRAGTLSPLTFAFQNHFPTTPGGLSFGASPQPLQGGNTPGANAWLIDDDDQTWSNFLNERRETPSNGLVAVG